MSSRKVICAIESVLDSMVECSSKYMCGHRQKDYDTDVSGNKGMFAAIDAQHLYFTGKAQRYAQSQPNQVRTRYKFY